MTDEVCVVEESLVSDDSLLSVLRHHSRSDVAQRVIGIHARCGLVRIRGVDTRSGGIDRHILLILYGKVSSGIEGNHLSGTWVNRNTVRRSLVSLDRGIHICRVKRVNAGARTYRDIFPVIDRGLGGRGLSRVYPCRRIHRLCPILRIVGIVTLSDEPVRSKDNRALWCLCGQLPRTLGLSHIDSASGAGECQMV